MCYWMHTVRCSGHLRGGVCLGGCLSEEGVCLRGMSAWGGVSAWWVHTPWTRRQMFPLWTEFLTHACENITFPWLLLRTVKIYMRMISRRQLESVLLFQCCVRRGYMIPSRDSTHAISQSNISGSVIPRIPSHLHVLSVICSGGSRISQTGALGPAIWG